MEKERVDGFGSMGGVASSRRKKRGPRKKMKNFESSISPSQNSNFDSTNKGFLSFSLSLSLSLSQLAPRR
jgi:hypothetical protein